MKHTIKQVLLDGIANNFHDDISLLVQYAISDKSLRDNPHFGERFYFIAKTEHGEALSTQFLLNDVSYDLFPMTWQRLLDNAAFDRPQTYLLLDTEVLYCDSPETLARFKHLQAEATRVLKSEYGEVAIYKAREYFTPMYGHLYNVQQERDIVSQKIHAMLLLEVVASCLLFVNQTYVTGGHNSAISPIQASLELPVVPGQYADLVEQILFTDDPTVVTTASTALAEGTRKLIVKALRNNDDREPSIAELFGGYYEEMHGNVKRFRQAIADEDYCKLFEIASSIQTELAQFCAYISEGVWYNDADPYAEYSAALTEQFNFDLLAPLIKRDLTTASQAIDTYDRELRTFVTSRGIDVLTFNEVTGLIDHLAKQSKL